MKYKTLCGICGEEILIEDDAPSLCKDCLETQKNLTKIIDSAKKEDYQPLR